MNIRKYLAKAVLSFASIVGGYNATNSRRKFISQQMASRRDSANALLNGDLQALRAHCRQLERNNSSARAGIEALAALVVGSGISLEPNTGDEDTNKAIGKEFKAWLIHLGINGEDIFQLQHLGFREVVSTGELVWRIVPSDEAIPYAILPLDSEWIVDDEVQVPGEEFTVVNGISVDQYGRAVSYYLANPDATTDKTEIVPASSIVHAFERRRPVQNRGEPWLTPVIETLMQEHELVESELYAARQTAGMAIAITSEHGPVIDDDVYGTPKDPATQLQIGGVVRLFPGEEVSSLSHTRPSQGISPFRQMLRGDIAAALRIPQRFLDRDVSRANFSSMRTDMIDTDRLLGPVRNWFGHATIGRMYRLALPHIAAVLNIKVPNPDAYKLLPDVQPYVDPTKDIAASLMAIAGGLSTYEKEIGKRGGDWRQVWEQLATEQQHIATEGLKITDKIPQGAGVEEPQPDTDPEDEDQQGQP